jgi:hypothetical protein
MKILFINVAHFLQKTEKYRHIPKAVKEQEMQKTRNCEMLSSCFMLKAGLIF